ncbi:MAG TPA: NAD(P)/FAD-dependent oxidoreductase [Chryseosolibacter sp.]|nr:NAD(P)/FAD-dependent oxidoreductase [Chryseosolibacter sp.]
MTQEKFDVIIIGGSYSGLAAGMALGRALKKVLIIDSGMPCNRFTPHSHNFITQDGKVPAEIAALAKHQVEQYSTVQFFSGLAISAGKKGNEFHVSTGANTDFIASKLIFATGIRDLMPDIPGFEACWGKSVIHCPYCHGYEVRSERTGILGNGEYAFEFASLISNWTSDLAVYTNGKSSLTAEQTQKLRSHNIGIIEDEIEKLEHQDGYVEKIIFSNGRSAPLKAVYTRPAFVQHCNLPELLGCELTEDGFIKTDNMQRTTIPGVYACGDNTTRMRTVANAVSMGTTAGMMVNKEMVLEVF